MQTSFDSLVLRMVPKWVSKYTLQTNEMTFTIFPQSVFGFFYFLKNHTATQFKMLVDITAVDYPSRANRFEVVYHLLSLQYNTRLRVKVPVNENIAIDSITSIYPTANWFERETWDMFGICFPNHPDLRRCLRTTALKDTHYVKTFHSVATSNFDMMIQRNASFRNLLN